MSSTPCILALNRNRRNLELLEGFLGKSGFTMHPANSLEELDAALDRGIDISLALLDLAGFDSTIWERCDRLRRSGIPFLVISPKPSGPVQPASLTSGAKGVLVKPLSSKALLSVIKLLIKS